MSGKIKFPSHSSTPVKSKVSDSSPTSISPIKGIKYKSFLASVLTPSQTKKWLRRKKSQKSEESFQKESKAELEGSYKDQASDDFYDPAYSSIQDLQLKETHSVVDSSSVLNICEPSENLGQSILNPVDEPLYSTVNKKKKNKVIHSDVSIRDSSSVEQCKEKTDSEYTLYGEAKFKNEESSNKKLIEEQKEEIRLLVERMKELTKENRELHKNIETIIREEKWKEDSLHAKLKLKITQLEADTHKEVNCLSDQIKTLCKERKVLSDQVQQLHEENKLLKLRYEDACDKVKSMISPEFMKKVVDEHQMSLNQIKKKNLEDIKKLQQENEALLDSKITLTGEVEGLKEKVQLLMAKNETLKNTEQELLHEKNRILLQLEESKQMQQEAENMLLSLLKITETISIERDLLLNKSSFQDQQQKLLQSTIMDYTLNMGRLQEHISILGREKSEELKKLKSGEYRRDESLKTFYGKQLDLLQSKVLNQSNTINELESEKSKLELQLESLWQAACTGKSKVTAVNCDT